MFVLGIDPGLSRCGYGLVERSASDLVAHAGGVIRSDPREPLPQRLMGLSDELGKLMGELSPDVVVVERVFFQTNVKTAMATGQASGLALAAAARRGAIVEQYTSNEVKMAVVGFGAATKQQVQEMVTRILRLDELPKPPDVADALALAVCHLAGASLKGAVAAAGGTR